MNKSKIRILKTGFAGGKFPKKKSPRVWYVVLEFYHESNAFIYHTTIV